MKSKERRNNKRIRLHDEDNTYILLVFNEMEIKGRIYDYSRFGLGVCISTEKAKLIKKTHPIKNCIIFAYGHQRELGNGKVVHLETMQEEIFLGVYLEKEFVDMDTLMDKQSLFLQEDEIKKIRMHFSIQDGISSEFFSISCFLLLLTVF